MQTIICYAPDDQRGDLKRNGKPPGIRFSLSVDVTSLT